MRIVHTLQQQEDENEHLKNSLQAAQIQIAILEKAISNQENGHESSLPKHVILLSSDESTALEQELITLKNERNTLSSSDRYQRLEVTKLEDTLRGETAEKIRLQEELRTVEQRLLESEQTCKEQEKTLNLQRTQLRDLEQDLAQLKTSIVEPSYGSLLVQSQAAKDVCLMDKYSCVDETDVNTFKSKYLLDAASKSKALMDASSNSKSLMDADFQDDATDYDLYSRYGPMDEKDDVFFQHYNDIISDLKLKLESRESEIQFIRTSLKSKDETIVSLRNTLNHVKANQIAAEAKMKSETSKLTSALRVKEKNMPIKQPADQKPPEKVNDHRPDEEVTHSDPSDSFKNTMMEGLSSLKDMARQVITPNEDIQYSPPRYSTNQSEHSSPTTS
jgi:chromosome segregation ATPase